MFQSLRWPIRTGVVLMLIGCAGSRPVSVVLSAEDKAFAEATADKLVTQYRHEILTSAEQELAQGSEGWRWAPMNSGTHDAPPTSAVDLELVVKPRDNFDRESYCKTTTRDSVYAHSDTSRSNAASFQNSLDSLASVHCGRLNIDALAPSLAHALDSLHARRADKAIRYLANRYRSRIPGLDDFASDCENARSSSDCAYGGGHLEWSAFRAARDLQEAADAIGAFESPAADALRESAPIALRYVAYMARSHQVTPDARENLQADQYLKSLDREFARNQAISDAIARQKQSRTPAQRDSATLAACRALGIDKSQCLHTS